MADLESVLQDVSYLMAMEKSKSGSKLAVTKKVALPDASVHCVVDMHLAKLKQRSFKTVYNQQLGKYYFDQFYKKDSIEMMCLRMIEEYRTSADVGTRSELARKIYDGFIMPDRLANESTLDEEAMRQLNETLQAKKYPTNLFEPLTAKVNDQIDSTIFREFLKSPQYVRFCQWKYLEVIQPEVITPDDFTIHRIIGRGGFGEVYGCRKDDSGRMFALKCLDKRRIKSRHGEDLVFNERNILTQVNSAFVVNLHYAFQSSDKLYLIMDLMNGGDLHYHLTQHGVFSESDVRFYAAELILGLEHLHSLNIVYRDLKPSNILLDEAGHVRISDLGLAQNFSRRLPSSSVGTHGYMAPEVILKGVQYSFTADWFSLGCVLHKLLLGHSPFRGSHAKKEEIDAVTLTKEVVLPDIVSTEMKALLYGLLTRDATERLGCRGRGADELKELAFFLPINWLDAMNQRLKPPLVPPRGEVNAADTFDIGSFSDDDVKGVKLHEADQEKYDGFNIVVSPMWQAEMMETVFNQVNADKDKAERKEQMKFTKAGVAPYSAAGAGGCLLEGYAQKLNMSTPLLTFWQRRYLKLFHGRVEWCDGPYNISKSTGIVTFDSLVLVMESTAKGSTCITLQVVGVKKEHIFKFDSKVEHDCWLEKVKEAAHDSQKLLLNGPKAMRKTSTDDMLTPSRPRNLRQMHSVPPTGSTSVHALKD